MKIKNKLITKYKYFFANFNNQYGFKYKVFKQIKYTYIYLKIIF